MTYSLADVLRVYLGSNGDATKALYDAAEALGPAGHVAVNLFRACKASERAKVYKGRGFRGAAYDRKQWAMDNLCKALLDNPNVVGEWKWGWGIDEHLQERGAPHHHVLYVELPTGQVSFHTGYRGPGPDYVEEWDGIRGQGADRICRWMARLFAGEAAQ